MRKWMVLLLCAGIFCGALTGCRISKEFWIRKNEPMGINQTIPSDTRPVETAWIPETPDQLRLDGTITEEPALCFAGDLEDLRNDIGFYWGRFLPEELWSQPEEKTAPYSREKTHYRQLDPDPMIKNEPPICVYLSTRNQICEVSAILLTHDWTQAKEENFLHRGETLLKCFWPDCGEEEIRRVTEEIRKDIVENLYPDNEDIPRPIKVYVHGNAAAYGYTLGNHISFNVIPINDSRINDMEAAGVTMITVS